MVLCLKAWGCLFSGTSGTVVVVGVQRLFALWVGVALCNHNGAQQNEDCNVLLCGGIAKSVTEINNMWAGIGD
jgi:hypothetical protein